MQSEIDFKPVFRISVFAPPDAVAGLLKAVQAIVPLGDAHYDGVHWLLDGARERFRPLSGANPTVGSIGEPADVASTLLIFAIPRDETLLQRVLNEAVLPQHPWESPSIFIDESRQVVRR